MQTYNDVLHVYGMHISKEAKIPTIIGGLHETADLRRVDIFLQQSQTLSSNGASASTFVGDGRSLLFGFSDGSLQLYSWQAKVACSPWTCMVLPSIHPLLLFLSS